MHLSTNLPWEKANPLWAASINPVLANLLVQATDDPKYPLLSMEQQLYNDRLGRKPQGWFIVDQTASASIYRSQPFNSNTLTLTSSAACTVSLWVF